MAVFTVRETLRRRLIAVTAVISGVFLLLFLLLCRAVAVGQVGAVAGRPQAAAANLVLLAAWPLLGMYLARSFSGLLAILAAAGAIGGELENGSLQSVLARPVQRWAVLLGKFTGFGLVLVPYTLVLQLAVAVIARAVLGAWLPDVGLALLLLPAEPLGLLALTLLGSTRLPAMANGAGAVLLFGLGVVGGDLRQLAVLGGVPALGTIGIWTDLLVPGDVFYREVASRAVAGLGGGLVPHQLGPLAAVVTPSPAMLTYAVAYIPLVLGLAAWSFARRDA